VIFYEKDVPYYARHRDLVTCEYCDLRLYADWDEVRLEALHNAADSDIVMTASYTPDGARISDETLELARPLHVFYDLDTPITLGQLENGPLDYLCREQISAFDLYLSFTGGRLLWRLEQEYGARGILKLRQEMEKNRGLSHPRLGNQSCKPAPDGDAVKRRGQRFPVRRAEVEIPRVWRDPERLLREFVVIQNHC